MTTETNEAQAIRLLADLYIMCCECADFSNGVTHQGIDEGRVLAGRHLAEVTEFLRGKNERHDEYVSLYDVDASAETEPPPLEDCIPF